MLLARFHAAGKANKSFFQVLGKRPLGPNINPVESGSGKRTTEDPPVGKKEGRHGSVTNLDLRLSPVLAEKARGKLPGSTTRGTGPTQVRKTLRGGGMTKRQSGDGAPC